MNVSLKFEPTKKMLAILPVLVFEWEDGFVIGLAWIMWGVSVDFKKGAP